MRLNCWPSLHNFSAFAQVVLGSREIIGHIWATLPAFAGFKYGVYIILDIIKFAI